MGLRIRAGVDVGVSCIIHYRHLQTDHIPEWVWSNPIGRNEPIITAIMKLHGYEPVAASKGSLTFIRIPIHHSSPHEAFVSCLKEGIKGIVAGSTHNELLSYIQLPRNSTLKRDSIFSDRILRQKWPGKSGLHTSSAEAERLCTFLTSNTTSDRDIWPFSNAQMSKVFDSVRGLCLRGFHWHTHAPVAGQVSVLQDKNSWWGDLSEQSQVAARLLGFDRKRWDEDEAIPLYEKALDDLSKEERRAALSLGLEDEFEM